MLIQFTCIQIVITEHLLPERLSGRARDTALALLELLTSGEGNTGIPPGMRVIKGKVPRGRDISGDVCTPLPEGEKRKHGGERKEEESLHHA